MKKNVFLIAGLIGLFVAYPLVANNRLRTEIQNATSSNHDIVIKYHKPFLGYLLGARCSDTDVLVEAGKTATVHQTSACEVKSVEFRGGSKDGQPYQIAKTKSEILRFRIEEDENKKLRIVKI